MKPTTTSVLIDSYKFTSITLVSKIIQFPVSIIIANFLGPLDYGNLGYAMLFLTYAGWVTFSAMSSATREMPGLIKQKRFAEASQKQNIGFTIDIVTSIFVSAGLIVIALSHENIIHKNLILLVTILFFLSKIRNIYGGINFTYQRYNLAAKAKLINTFLSPLLLLSLIFISGVYAPLLVSIIITTIVIIYLSKQEQYGLKFIFDKAASFNAAKIGLQLNFNSILHDLFRHKVDITIIAIFFSKVELGLYLFALKFYTIIFSFVDDYTRVLTPKIWAEADAHNSTQEGFYSLRRMAIIISLGCAIIIGFAQLGFITVSTYLTPKYIDSQLIFIVIISYLYWNALALFPNLILLSGKINKQNVLNIVWSFALLINILLDLGAIKLGYGIIGIAIATTLSQVIFTIVTYYIASKYLFFNFKEFLHFLYKLLVPFIIPVCITFVHWFVLDRYPLHIIILFSILLQIVVWVIFIYYLYNDYFNKNKLINLLSLIKSTLVKKLSKS